MAIKLANACRACQWEEARRLFEQDPYLLVIARDRHDNSPAYWAACDGELDTLQHMADALSCLQERQTKPFEKRTFQMVFGKESKFAWSPIHIAAYHDHKNCLLFLLDHLLPLNNQTDQSTSFADFSSLRPISTSGYLATLDFIVWNAPCIQGKTPLKMNLGMERLRDSRVYKYLDMTYFPLSMVSFSMHRRHMTAAPP
jgi:hypothetical protein